MVHLSYHLTVFLCLTLLCALISSAKDNSDARNRETPKKPRNGRNRMNRDEGSFCELEIACRCNPMTEPQQDEGVEETSERTAPVRLPIRGPRGPPGTPGERGTDGVDGLQGLPGLPGISAPVPPKVAFFAGLSENFGPVSENQDLVFDKLFTNIGGAYNSTTGHFTAPVNGTYQFNIVLSAQGRQKAAVMLIKNSDMVLTAWAESLPFWSTASNVAVLTLTKADTVRLVLLERASYVHGYMYTTFSGFLIF